jgi:pilus assembly protein CpaE
MSKTILVVDDSEVVRKLIDYQLSQAGYTILTASDGSEGVHMARKHEPDVIIMDVQMPEMDGYEASRLIRQVHATMNTPIIMLTSLANVSSMQLGYDAGVDDYLTKPFQPNELQLRVEAILRRVKRVEASVQEHETSIIGVFSLRGGSGCTSLATNLAVGLTTLWDRPAMLTDFATPMGSCDIFLDVTTDNHLGTILQHDLKSADEELIRGYLENHTSGVRLLAGIQNPVDAELLSENLVSLIINTVAQESFYTILDLPHNFEAATLVAIDKVGLFQENNSS